MLLLGYCMLAAWLGPSYLWSSRFLPSSLCVLYTPISPLRFSPRERRLKYSEMSGGRRKYIHRVHFASSSRSVSQRDLTLDLGCSRRASSLRRRCGPCQQRDLPRWSRSWRTGGGARQWRHGGAGVRGGGVCGWEWWGRGGCRQPGTLSTDGTGAWRSSAGSALEECPVETQRKKCPLLLTGLILYSALLIHSLLALIFFLTCLQHLIWSPFFVLFNREFDGCPQRVRCESFAQDGAANKQCEAPRRKGSHEIKL